MLTVWKYDVTYNVTYSFYCQLRYTYMDIHNSTLLDTYTYQHHPYVGFRLQYNLSLSVCMHCLAWSVRVEGLGEVHQCFAQTYVPHFPIQQLLFWVVVQNLLVLLNRQKQTDPFYLVVESIAIVDEGSFSVRIYVFIYLPFPL